MWSQVGVGMCSVVIMGREGALWDVVSRHSIASRALMAWWLEPSGHCKMSSSVPQGSTIRNKDNGFQLQHELSGLAYFWFTVGIYSWVKGLADNNIHYGAPWNFKLWPKLLPLIICYIRIRKKQTCNLTPFTKCKAKSIYKMSNWSLVVSYDFIW